MQADPYRVRFVIIFDREGLRQHIARTDDARALLREIFVTAADFCPDETAGTLINQPAARQFFRARLLSQQVNRGLGRRLVRSC